MVTGEDPIVGGIYIAGEQLSSDPEKNSSSPRVSGRSWRSSCQGGEFINETSCMGNIVLSLTVWNASSAFVGVSGLQEEPETSFTSSAVDGVSNGYVGRAHVVPPGIIPVQTETE